jgi:FHS family glucose/mannose:H+ symporter-like MFS transporter
MSSPAQLRVAESGSTRALDSSGVRRSLAAFLVAGILNSFLGAILPTWRYHLSTDFIAVGNYFLSLNLGFLLSIAAAHYLLPRKGVKFTLVLGNALACAGFLFLAAVSPPAAEIWRLAGVVGIGVSAGLLNTAMFHAISPLYQQDRAATVNLAGVLFGLGCLLTALLVAGTYYAYSVPGILTALAIVPGACAIISAQAKLSPTPLVRPMPLAQVWRDFRNPGAVLFSLLLFFQFANECSIAGWLPLFLIRRLGISPASSLVMLTLYWAALLVGRIASQLVIKRANSRLLLVGSVLSALLGTFVLASTNNRFGAVMGILFVGAGFASVYPLVLGKIGSRFPYYHPGLYNGLFSFALTGGFLAPWSLGYFTRAWGIEAVMFLPMFCTCMVFVLVLLILLEAKLTGLSNLREA